MSAERPHRTVRVLFVCLGNICRSPTAAGVFRQQVAAAGLSALVEVDSAGMLRYHAGKPPDPRACAAALRRGIDISAMRARQVDPEDYEKFDLLIAMDATNREYLLEHAPARSRDRIHLLLDFADPAVDDFEVPDPYYGDGEGFEVVLDLVAAGGLGLLKYIENDLRRERG